MYSNDWSIVSKNKVWFAERNPVFLEEFRLNAADRRFQFWDRSPLSIDLYSKDVYFQKMNYITH